MWQNIARMLFDAARKTSDSGLRGVPMVANTALANPTRAIYVGGAGNATLTMADGSVVTFNNLAGGTIYPISVTMVATGATASNIVALY